MVFVPIYPMNVRTVRSLTHSWDHWGYPQNFSNPWICPSYHFSNIFNGLLFRRPLEYVGQIRIP